MNTMVTEKQKKLIALDPMLWEDLYANIASEYPATMKLFEIIDKDITPPYSISINGCWGSGKTTFLLLLKKLLEDKKYKTVWFNPWEYERTDNVVLAFLQKIVIDFKKEFDIKDIGIFSLAFLTSGLDIAAKILTGGSLSYRGVKEITKDVVESLSSKFETYEDIVEEIKKDFTRITNEISGSSKKPIIIFLDDLDRCLPDRALELLEAIKNFFVVKNAKVIFISGIDTDVVKKFINQKYHNIEGNFAINYFKKIFNLTINIPKFNIINLEKVLINHISNLFGIDKEISEKISKRVIELSLLAGISSFRSIFNIINNLFIVYSFADDKEKLIESKIKAASKPGEIDTLMYDVVLLMLTIKENWNDFYEQIIIESRKNKKEDFSTLANNKRLHADFLDKDMLLKDFMYYSARITQSYPCLIILEKYLIS
jgi:hypothetical protein